MKPGLKLLALALCALCAVNCYSLRAQEPPRSETVTNIAYHSPQQLESGDDYLRRQCRLDLRYPAQRQNFATIIWFHGGGLTGGSRHFPKLNAPEHALVAVGYRLSPKANHPAYLEDAAAATAWTLRNIERYGGDPGKVFLAGHSAGGYLCAMVGMDPRWLQAHGLSHRQLAGLIPVSAQVTTHFNVKKLMGDTGAQYRPIIDDFAPLHHCAAELPPICLVMGDRKIEWKCRVEENELLAASLRALGHPHVEFHEQPGCNHGTCVKGAMPIARDFIAKTLNARSGSATP